MTGWAEAPAALAALALFSFADPAVTESSGLVDSGGEVFTVNDSGAGPVLYEVDATTGRTLATTTYSDHPVVDVEALAPAPGGDVWVGDIGDNLGSRESVTVYRVTPGRGDAPAFELTYPDGGRDAETLLAHPRTGRLFVVSKTVFGGVVYAAPSRLAADRPNRLTRFAQVPAGLLTDGAFWPDGRSVVLRGYGRATVLGFPGLGVVGTVALPAQEQGEGLAVGARGRVLLSSEGRGAEVLAVRLPPELTSPPLSPSATAVPPAAAPSSASAAPSPSAPRAAEAGPTGSGTGWWVLAAVGAAAGCGWLGWAGRRRWSRARE